ncbi:unnamed protein product [Parnassius apollo]|uniref:(apollo) hypothetical protein n=1 Tax=Parnassius apollo TaxID=110799 RepID=A0A8S3X6L3_PARAO|nr:unnamed protein product [Parnassius apollo]
MDSRARKLVNLAINNDSAAMNENTGNENPFSNPQPSTSRTLKQTILDETVSDFSSDDSVADPNYSPGSPSLLTQHKEMEIAVPNASVDMHITSGNETPENIGDISLLQQNQPVSCRKNKQENKLKRNLGQSYVTTSGKTIGKRQMKELPNCRNKCRQKISDKQRALIHKEVWNLGSYDLRAAFISSLITIQEKKTERLRVEDPDKQIVDNTHKNHFNVNSEKYRCVKGVFKKPYQ